VSKQWNPRKPTVELRPSRIRRDPRLIQREEKKVVPMSAEQEIWLGVTGVVLFAMAIAVVTAGFSVVTAYDGGAAGPKNVERFGQCYNSDISDCVIDGDTVYVGGTKVQIAGMNAPRIQGAQCEAERSRGIDSAIRLAEILNRGTVTLGGAVHEPDGRLRRKVEVDGEDAAAAMIDAGAARGPGSEAAGWCSE